jgi:hypothetical protein
VLNAVSLSPISGATVGIVGPQTLSNLTNSAGQIAFNKTQAGSYNVIASRQGYASASASVNLTKNTEIKIFLKPLTYTLTVHVVDASTDGLISAAAVVAAGPQSRSGVTDGGTVVFDNTQTGNYSITASKTGYTSASANVSLTENTEITIRLTASAPKPWLPYTEQWIVAIMLGFAAILGTSVMIFLIAGADRVRRKRKGK